ncbi:MAG TPA: S66 peptidase family protein [Homoserinimonas sp.]|nr:S66 peptidase family protein [Homoserinimonas sp.]
MVATSWPGSSVFPKPYHYGLATLRDVFGLEIVEYPSTRFTPDEASRNPEARADDLNRAFANPEIAAIFTVIGGDDSVRILPHLDIDAAIAHPKVLMGYSDTTTQLLTLAAAGLTTFNGPAVMAGLAQLESQPGLEEHIRSILFEPAESYDYRPYGYRLGDAPDWATQRGDETGASTPDTGWRWLQGDEPRQGALTGGCIEVLDMMVGTPSWPTLDFFDGKILFLETSEDVPAPAQVGFWLRNYGAQGILNRINGLVFGRPRGYTSEMTSELDRIIVERLAEWGATDIPVLAGCDFGHIDPQWILPHNVLAELDPPADRFRLLEPAVS